MLGGMVRAGLLMVMLMAGVGCGGNAPVGRAVDETPVTRPAAVERVMEVGRSVEGKGIVMHVFGEGSGGLLIIGGIHGSEGTSAFVARRLVELLRERPELWSGRAVAVIPEANPDGLARKMRTNLNLVDLNRNFPAKNWGKTRKGMYWGGEQAASEPETVALMKAFELRRPGRVISIHSMDRPCNNYDGPGEGMAELLAKHNGYPVKGSIGYPTPGSLGSWAGIDQGIAMVTLELPRAASGETAWEGNREGLVGVVEERVESRE